MLQKSELTFELNKGLREGITDFENNIFPNHFLGLICGKPGSGKTSLLRFLLTNPKLFYKKYDFVFVMSPSFVEYSSLFLPPSNFTSELSYSFILQKIKETDQIAGYKNILFIMDDLVSELSKCKQSKEILSFIFNRRHILKNGMMSILMTSQKYNFIPTFIRVNLNLIIFFKLNKKEIECIRKELAFDDSEMNYAVIEAFERGAYNFVIYNVDRNRYYLNFDEIKFQQESSGS